MLVEKKDDKIIILKGSLDEVLSSISNGKFEIKAVKVKRSLQQNRLMWAWLTCAEKETGTPKEDFYDYFCKRFLSRVIRFNYGYEDTISTTSSHLNTKEFKEFLDKIKINLNVEFGINVPDPKDLGFEEFMKIYGR